MSRDEPSRLARVVRLLIFSVVVGATAVVHSAPLLHPYPLSNLEINGRTQATATDGTNVLLALYSETTPSISAMLILPDGSSSGASWIAQVASRPYVAFNGTNYLIAWVVNAGGSAELRGRSVSISGVLTGSNFSIRSGVNASGLAGLSWDGESFLALWGSSTNGRSTVQGQLLGRDGMAVGPVLDISSPGGTATNSATTGKDNHIAVWMESTGGTNEWHMRARAVTSDGILSEISTLSSAPSQTANPVGVAFGNTEAMAIWSREVGPYYHPCNGSNSNYWLMLFGRTMDERGSPQGEEFELTRMQGRQTDPKIAFDATNYLAVWTDSRFSPCLYSSNTMVIAQQISTNGTLVNPEFRPVSMWDSLADAVAFAGGQFVVAEHSYYRTVVTLLRSGGLGTGFFRNLVPETNGYLQVEFTANNERGAYWLQGSTNFVDWQVVAREDGPYALYTNRISRYFDPFPGYVGGRFYRAVNPIDVCLSNLLVLEHVKAVWAFETGKTATAAPTEDDLFGLGKYLPIKPACPNGGMYQANRFDTRPTCTLSAWGHSL